MAANETDNDHEIALAVEIAKEVIGTPNLVLIIRADDLQEVSHLRSSSNTLSHKRHSSRIVLIAVATEKTQGAGKEDLQEADETYSLIQDY